MVLNIRARCSCFEAMAVERLVMMARKGLMSVSDNENMVYFALGAEANRKRSIMNFYRCLKGE